MSQLIKIQIKSIFGQILFEYEKENNTIKDTVEEAIEQNANLENANLYNAYLENANLRNANLENANLYNANLYNANLENANIENANIENANLYNANLENANLENANLENAKNKETATIPMFCKWSHGIKGDKIIIGCKEKTIIEWEKFFSSEEEYSTKRGTEEFKQIQAIFEAYKSYLNHLKK
jgi:hypothetical protein